MSSDMSKTGQNQRLKNPEFSKLVAHNSKLTGKPQFDSAHAHTMFLRSTL